MNGPGDGIDDGGKSAFTQVRMIVLERPNLLDEPNREVLSHLEGKSAHSDLFPVLVEATNPLGDILIYCHDPGRCRYIHVSSAGVIFAFAVEMSLIVIRLDERMKERALASGAAAYPKAGSGWVSFEMFRSDWPEADLKFWARKAYGAARESVFG